MLSSLSSGKNIIIQGIKYPLFPLKRGHQLFLYYGINRGSNPKKVGFLDWICMGNPKPKKNPKIQKIQKIKNPNPKKIQKSKPKKNPKNPKSKPKKNPNPIFF